MVFEPIDNREVEFLLEAARSDDNKGNKKLDDFVVAEFFSKEQLKFPLVILTPEIKYMREGLKHHLILNGDERRKITNILNSKHSIDVLKAIKYYEIGDVINPITMISAIFHDDPEEGKETVIQIGNFLEYTIIHSLDLDVKTREQYLADVDKIRENINLLTDPYYKCLQNIKMSVDAYFRFLEKNKIEITPKNSRLKEIIDEERGQSLISKLHNISKTVLSNDYPKYIVEPIKKYIDALAKDHIDYLRGVNFKKWSPRVIKLGDGFSQNYELDEIPYLNGEGLKRYLKKHAIIYKHGQDHLDELKKTIKEDDIFVDGLTLKEYNELEDFKIRGPDVLQAIAKRFFNLDFCCNHINATTHYNDKLATTINLKKALVNTTLNVIKTRKKHLKDYFHVTEEAIKKIEEDIQNYERDGHLYRVTDIGSPNDMLLKYYLTAMRGEYSNLMSLDFDKSLQYRHLKLWELLFLKYRKDCVRERSGKLKNKDLFTFDWGKYLSVRNEK